MSSAHLCIARHGETDWNKQGILQGWLDVPLNDRGRSQARELAARLGGVGFSAVWASTLARSHETAQIIADALGLPTPQRHLGLRERHFGAVQGIPKSELAEQNPVMLAQIVRRNPAAAFVGGESMDEFADRLMDAFLEIGQRHRGERVLVITHGWGLDAAIRHVQGLARSAILNVKPSNGESVWITVSDRVMDAMGLYPPSRLHR